MKIMPQEMEVWYLLPSVRKELAQIFVQKKLKQNEISMILGISTAAVSQYQNAKRGKELNFSMKEKKLIKDAAENILNDKRKTNSIIYRLCEKLKQSTSFCKLHMKKDKSLPKNCNLCFK